MVAVPPGCGACRRRRRLWRYFFSSSRNFWKASWAESAAADASAPVMAATIGLAHDFPGLANGDNLRAVMAHTVLRADGDGLGEVLRVGGGSLGVGPNGGAGSGDTGLLLRQGRSLLVAHWMNFQALSWLLGGLVDAQAPRRDVVRLGTCGTGRAAARSRRCRPPWTWPDQWRSCRASQPRCRRRPCPG